MQPQYGQKRVSAGSIVPGDVVFRPSPHGDLMMDVKEVRHEPDGGNPLYAYIGPVYALNSSNVGDPITGDSLTNDIWKIPASGQVDKKVPLGEAEWRA